MRYLFILLLIIGACQATGYFKSVGMEYESYVEMIMNRE
jgi:hypothetical protein